jgi:hypothetical protein
MDDIIVYCLFASKRHQNAPGALKPEPSFSTHQGSQTLLQAEPLMTNEIALTICNIYQKHTTPGAVVGDNSIRIICQGIVSKFPWIIRGEEDGEILKQ